MPTIPSYPYVLPYVADESFTIQFQELLLTQCANELTLAESKELLEALMKITYLTQMAQVLRDEGIVKERVSGEAR